jgi:hypothetical protein
MANATDPKIEAYLALLPEQQSNPVGTELRKRWAKVAESMIFGAFTPPPGGLPEQARYSQLFFGLDPSSLDALDSRLMSLGGVWSLWLYFGGAMVTDTLLQVAPSTQALMSSGGWNGPGFDPNKNLPRQTSTDEQPMLARLYASALDGYSMVWNATYAADIVPGAAGEYIALITDEAWITAKMESEVSGTWTDAAWEMFHHAVKILSLGGTKDQVTAAFARIQAFSQSQQNGPLLPAEADKDTWHSYRGFIGNPVLTIDDFAADGGARLTQPSYDASSTPWPSGSGNPDALAKAFVSSMPYSWHGSCFSPATRVLLADGSDRALGEIAPGDRVWTPEGPASVRVAERVLQGRRALFCLDTSTMAFTDAHPFVDGETGGSLAVQGARAARFAPGIDHRGVWPLAPGATVVAVDRRGQQRRRRVETVTLDHAPVDPTRELIGLVVAPSAAGFPAYAVGDGGSSDFFLVRSEVLRFEEHPFGTVAGLGMFLAAAEALGPALATVERQDDPLLVHTVDAILPRVISDAVAAVASEDGTVIPDVVDPTPLHEQLDAIMAGFHDRDGRYDWRLGALQGAIAQTALVRLDHVVRSGWRPFLAAAPSERAGVAVTLHDLVAQGHFDLAGDWTLTVTVDGAEPRTARLPPPTTSHHRPAGITVLRPAPIGAELCLIEVRLTGAGGTLSGRTVVPRPGRGLVATTLPLHRILVQGLDAVVRFDVRALEPDALARHATAPPPDWDAAACLAFATRLGRALGAAFVERFPPALAGRRT